MSNVLGFRESGKIADSITSIYKDIHLIKYKFYLWLAERFSVKTLVVKRFVFFIKINYP